MHRRTFLQTGTRALMVTSFTSGLPTFRFQNSPDVQPITSGDRQHWFGYYDKWQVDPSGRFALGMSVDLFFRSPKPTDQVQIGIIDLEHHHTWKPIGTSSAWGWQQGCMLQWIPGSAEEVIWNDREGDRFIARIYNIRTGEQRILPKPVYALSPDASYGIGADFNRIQNMRPGYGYVGIPDPNAAIKAPQDSGIYKIDLATGEHQTLITLAQIAAIDHQGSSLQDYWHYFNHLLVSPDGERFIFLHRWRHHMLGEGKANSGFITRMFTADKHGEDLYILDPSGYTSHFIWRDPEHICAWTKPKGKKAAFYLFRDKSDHLEIVGEGDMPLNGHNTYVPHTDQEWILNDTYPSPTPERKQTLYLYHVPSGRKVILGKFYEPEQFSGEWRCDLHPRCDQAGRRVFFDSTHAGGKRQMYSIDIADIVG